MTLSLWQNRTVATTPQIDALLTGHAPVAIGVSGGKDSSAVAYATLAHLDAVGHKGPRVLVHSDLGLTEWRESLPMCRLLGQRLETDLVVTRRAKGGMMERWEQRWADNVARYAALSCVQLILPWSTPGMRFCTSELKTTPICDALSRRWPGRTIVSVTGIRRQESSGRAKAPVARPEPRLTSVTRQTSGVTWNPILDWSLDDVLAYLRHVGMPLHEAYTKYGMSRVSCVNCIMSSLEDLRSAAKGADNWPVTRRMIDLEIRSTFAFHGSHWLGDVSPAATAEQVRAIGVAKDRGARRVAAEARLPAHLLYEKGWPTCVPTRGEAEVIAGVRIDVARAIDLGMIAFVNAEDVIGRYRQLLAMKKAKRKAVPA